MQFIQTKLVSDQRKYIYWVIYTYDYRLHVRDKHILITTSLLFKNFPTSSYLFYIRASLLPFLHSYVINLPFLHFCFTLLPFLSLAVKLHFSAAQPSCCSVLCAAICRHTCRSEMLIISDECVRNCTPHV